MKPYYAVIFTSTLTSDISGYSEMAAQMEALAKQQPGYLGFESAREDLGISISYWESLEDIKHWKEHLDHQQAQLIGRERWYSAYTVRICAVEREYQFNK
jgi:heme-degrading monooxygenase HmoA